MFVCREMFGLSDALMQCCRRELSFSVFFGGRGEVKCSPCDASTPCPLDGYLGAHIRPFSAFGALAFGFSWPLKQQQVALILCGQSKAGYVTSTDSRRRGATCNRCWVTGTISAFFFSGFRSLSKDCDSRARVRTVCLHSGQNTMGNYLLQVRGGCGWVCANGSGWFEPRLTCVRGNNEC